MESQTQTPFQEQEIDHLSRSAERAPQAEVERLLELSRQAPDSRTALEYAERAVDLSPDDPRVQESVQRSVLARLHEDAFVAFVAETDRTYVVNFRNSRPIVIPKARTEPEPFPAAPRTEGEHVLGMIWWMLLGLLPAGIGALILSPIVVPRALRILMQHDASAREQRLAWVALNLASGLGLLGAFFTLLLVLHLVG